MSLPLLLLTPGAATGPEAAKRQRTGAIFFKAYRKGQFRQLSNLFGPVEWQFQAAKFKEGSVVREWLLDNAHKEWSKDEFDAARLRMKHDGKLESYVAEDGFTVASGLLAQMCSLIARNHESVDARHRLAFILGKATIVTTAEAEAWVRDHVNPELIDTAKDELLLRLLREKFAIPKYRELLKSTENTTLHEARGRRAPNRYEFHPLTDAQRRQNEALVADGSEPKWSEGGDVLGKLMMQVRSELPVPAQAVQ
jgi:hypothetical protein